MAEGCQAYHRPEPEIVGDAFRDGYSAWIDDCNARTRAGDSQVLCPSCGLWVWKSLFIDLAGARTGKMFARKPGRKPKGGG